MGGRRLYPARPTDQQIREVTHALEKHLGNDLETFARQAGVSPTSLRKFLRPGAREPMLHTTVRKIIQHAQRYHASSSTIVRAEEPVRLIEEAKGADRDDGASDDLIRALQRELGLSSPSSADPPELDLELGEVKVPSAPEPTGSQEVLAAADGLSPLPRVWGYRTYRVPPEYPAEVYAKAFADAKASIAAEVERVLGPDLQRSLDRILTNAAEIEHDARRLDFLPSLVRQAAPRVVDTASLHIRSDPWGGLPMECPLCAEERMQGRERDPNRQGVEPYDYNHMAGVRVNQGGDITIVGPHGTRLERGEASGRGSLVTIAFNCEGGHTFCLHFQFHKGCTYVWSETNITPDWLPEPTANLWRD